MNINTLMTWIIMMIFTPTLLAMDHQKVYPSAQNPTSLSDQSKNHPYTLLPSKPIKLRKTSANAQAHEITHFYVIKGIVLYVKHKTSNSKQQEALLKEIIFHNNYFAMKDRYTNKILDLITFTPAYGKHLLAWSKKDKSLSKKCLALFNSDCYRQMTREIHNLLSH